jgi:hypothetical protein
MNMQGQLTNPKAALAFMLAGKSFVTLRSLSSGNRYTYKIAAAPKRNPNDKDTWFVKLLNGQDNTNNYVYIGIIRNTCGNNRVVGYEFSWTSKSHVGKDAPSVLGMTFVVRMLAAGSMNGFEVWHEGRCGRCGKKLTVPESVASGFGPDCIEMVGGVRPTLSVSGAKIETDAARYERIKKIHDACDDFGDAKWLAIMEENGISMEDLEWFSKQQKKDPDYAVAVGGTPAQQTLPLPTSKKAVKANGTPVRNSDAVIRRQIEEYKANAPENYYQDGELSESEAFNVAYNMFRVRLERGQ